MATFISVRRFHALIKKDSVTCRACRFGSLAATAATATVDVASLAPHGQHS
jgi:hypothetical protein